MWDVVCGQRHASRRTVELEPRCREIGVGKVGWWDIGKHVASGGSL